MLLLLSHHGFEALRCADLLGEGLGGNTACSQSAGNCAENPLWDVTALIVCKMVVTGSRETDGVLVL